VQALNTAAYRVDHAVKFVAERRWMPGEALVLDSKNVVRVLRLDHHSTLAPLPKI